MSQQIILSTPEPVSCSHWGLFERPFPPPFVVPDGFKVDENDLRNMKPGSIIWVKPSKT